MPDPPFHAGNTKFAYQLHYHIGFRTRRCVPVFRPTERTDALHNKLREICRCKNYHLLETDTDDCWLRLLLSLRPGQAPSRVVQTIKTNTSKTLLDAFPEIEAEIGRRSLWARGYYVRSVGDVTADTIRGYVAGQQEHHKGESRVLAEYHDPAPDRLFDLRPFDHCIAEYNCHLVCSPLRHAPVIAARHAEGLLAHVHRIAAVREFDVISLAILEDHLHLFAALRPKQSPEFLALTVMNNTSHWVAQRNPGAMKVWNAPELWTPGAFVRSAGAATTNMVRAHLHDRSMLAD